MSLACGTDGSFAVLLDGSLTARWLAAARPRAASAAPLLGLRQAIGHAPVQIGASIGEAEIDVATLQSLVVGDVLLLDLPVDRPLRLTIAGRTVRRGAYLGSHQGRRALQLAATPPSSDSATSNIPHEH
jgi:flagellar motor switch protein FliM